MDLGTLAFVAVVVLGAAVIALARLYRTVYVYHYQMGIRYSKGRFDGVLAPGQYRILPSTAIVPVDMRSTVVSVPGQDILSADGVTVKVSLVARYRVKDPQVALHATESYLQSLYATLQVALRAAVGSRPVEDVLATRGELGAEAQAASAEPATALGLVLESVDVKDVMFTGELRKTFAQVVTARKEGLAALERARGETAALRNLANAARLVEGNPTLLQLRALQQVGQSKGSTLIMGMPAATTPIPIPHRDASPLIEPGPTDTPDERLPD